MKLVSKIYYFVFLVLVCCLARASQVIPTCESVINPHTLHLTWEVYCNDHGKDCDDSDGIPQCVDKEKITCESVKESVHFDVTWGQYCYNEGKFCDDSDGTPKCVDKVATCESIYMKHYEYNQDGKKEKTESITWNEHCQNMGQDCQDKHGWPQCIEKDSNPCDPNPCQNGGKCCRDNETETGFLCSCLDGFAGQLCQFPFCQPSCPTEAQCTIVDTEEGTAKAQCVCTEEGFQYNQEKNTCDKVGTTICQKITTIITEIECPKEELF